MIMPSIAGDRLFVAICMPLLVMCTVCIPSGCSKEEQPGSKGRVADLGTEDREPESNPRQQRSTTNLTQATEDVNDLLARESLSQEELEQLGAKFASNWEEMMDAVVAEYEAAPDARKDAILDRYIEMEKESRKQWDRTYKSAQGAGSAPSDEDIARRKYALFAGKDAGERKTRSESRSPDSAVKQARFYRAVQQRARKRGIDLRHRGG